MNSLLLFTLILSLKFNPQAAMPFSPKESLSPCLQESNCFLVEWEFKNLDATFQSLTEIINRLPRTSILTKTDTYIHALVRSLVFRFPDDLEILKIPKGNKIQVRSSSRIGVSDLGVNKKRVNNLYKQVKKLDL